MPRLEGFNYGAYPGIPAGIENASLSDTIFYSGTKAFVVDEDGVIALTMADGSEGTMIVKAGVQYAGDVKKFKSTGSSTVTAVTIFY
jgi:hypothetical protein